MFCLLRIRIQKWRIFPIKPRYALAFSLFLLLGAGIHVAVNLDIPLYVYNKHMKTDLYDKYYVPPENVAITFPSHRRNLIIIYMESIEATYLSQELGGGRAYNLIPNLGVLASKNINFSQSNIIGGPESLKGTGWTVAAIFGSLSGIPLSIPIYDNCYSGMGTFAPGATSLGDILKSNGYSLTFLMGSDATFGGRKDFLQLHGDFDVLDYDKAVEVVVNGNMEGRNCQCVVEEFGKCGRISLSDIVGVQEGNDVLSVLPSEYVYLSSPLLEPVFYVKYADRRLQTFAHRSCSPARPVRQGREKEEVQRKGAMIVCVDTSGSMFGRKERIAKSMAWELVEMARKRRRPLYLITFAVRVRCVEVTSLAPDEWYRDFLKATFTGGTDCNAVLRKALKMLGHEGFAFADVLLVSDFEFGECTEAVQAGILEARQRGTRFYGLSLGKAPNKLCGLFDKIWQV